MMMLVLSAVLGMTSFAAASTARDFGTMKVGDPTTQGSPRDFGTM